MSRGLRTYWHATRLPGGVQNYQVCKISCGEQVSSDEPPPAKNEAPAVANRAVAAAASRAVAQRRTMLKGGQRCRRLCGRLHQLDASTLWAGKGGKATCMDARCHSKQSKRRHPQETCRGQASPSPGALHACPLPPHLTAIVQLDDERLLVLALVACR